MQLSNRSRTALHTVKEIIGWLLETSGGVRLVWRWFKGERRTHAIPHHLPEPSLRELLDDQDDSSILA